MGSKLEEELKASLNNNYVPCAVIWELARKHRVSRKQVGELADELKARITDCQLGCFTVLKATHEDLVNMEPKESLVRGIQASLATDSTLPCPVAFKVARKLGATPMDVGDTASKMRVHISNCQLGCF